MSESVLVVDNRFLGIQPSGTGYGQLVTKDADKILFNITGNYTFMPRNEAEFDFTRKQIIPYVTINHEDKFLLLQRTDKQKEKRLHNKYSLGIGGHVNPEPAMKGYDVIVNGMNRELKEEIRLEEPSPPEFVGLINDDRNSVGRVHLGLLHIIHTSSPEFEVMEKDKMTAQWVKKDLLIDYYDKFETWSQIVYDYYIVKNGNK